MGKYYDSEGFMHELPTPSWLEYYPPEYSVDKRPVPMRLVLNHNPTFFDRWLASEAYAGRKLTRPQLVKE